MVGSTGSLRLAQGILCSTGTNSGVTRPHACPSNGSGRPHARSTATREDAGRLRNQALRSGCQSYGGIVSGDAGCPDSRRTRPIGPRAVCAATDAVALKSRRRPDRVDDPTLPHPVVKTLLLTYWLSDRPWASDGSQSQAYIRSRGQRAWSSALMILECMAPGDALTWISNSHPRWCNHVTWRSAPYFHSLPRWRPNGGTSSAQ